MGWKARSSAASSRSTTAGNLPPEDQGWVCTSPESWPSRCPPTFSTKARRVQAQRSMSRFNRSPNPQQSADPTCACQRKIPVAISPKNWLSLHAARTSTQGRSDRLTVWLACSKPLSDARNRSGPRCQNGRITRSNCREGLERVTRIELVTKAWEEMHKAIILTVSMMGLGKFLGEVAIDTSKTAYSKVIVL